MNTKKRFAPEVRKQLVLNAAVSAATKPGGWMSLTRSSIASEARCSEALISKYLGDMTAVRRAVMSVAIKLEILEIIAQSEAANDGFSKAPEGLRNRAVKSLL